MVLPVARSHFVEVEFVSCRNSLLFKLTSTRLHVTVPSYSATKLTALFANCSGYPLISSNRTDSFSFVYGTEPLRVNMVSALLKN